MPIDPISQALWGEIEKEARRQDGKDKASGYWIKCPSCGRRVVKKQLTKNGCYLCGWKGTKEEIKTNIKKKPDSSYKINCPGCGRQVIREEFVKKGCFVCGYKSKAEGENSG